jgi:MerR family transcriptional regulator, light-induced transcriptional regulator
MHDFLSLAQTIRIDPDSLSKSTGMSVRGQQEITVKHVLSPKDLATAIGVSESSLKRWTDDGLLKAARTAGGHRRIPLYEAIRFIRTTKQHVIRPEVLGLAPEGTSLAAVSTTSLNDSFYEAVINDDGRQVVPIILSAFLGGMSVASLCDGPIRSSLARIGEIWTHRPDGMMIEHRAVDRTIQILNLLRSTLPTPEPRAPRAVGAALSGDPYAIPSLMSSLVFADAGFEDHNLGPDTPVEAILEAIGRLKPAVVWLSASVSGREPAPVVVAASVFEHAHSIGAKTIVGGRGFGEFNNGSESPLAHPFIRVGSMTELSQHAERIHAELSTAAAAP